MQFVIRWISVLAAIGVVGGLVAMSVIALSNEPAKTSSGPFLFAVAVFFASLVIGFLMWLAGAWYDRVQSRSQVARGHDRRKSDRRFM